MLPRRRLGFFSGLAVVLILLGTLYGGTIALFAPWSYYLGGTFHLLPIWSGAGTLHAKSGDYVLTLWFAPESGGRVFNHPYFRGWVSLCTPRGERYSLRLSASMHQNPRTDTNGMEISMDMYQRRWNYSVTQEGRPRLTLRGRWQNPDLVMDDEGSLSRAFLPDGTPYMGPARHQPTVTETVPVVFHRISWWWLSGDCARK